MRYGRSVEDGFLPVYSVDTEEEARRLLVAACPTNIAGEFVAPELAEEQTLANLRALGRRLAAVEARLPRVDPPRTFEWRGRIRMWSVPGG